MRFEPAVRMVKLRGNFRKRNRTREVSPTPAQGVYQLSLRTCLLQIVCADGRAILRRLP